MRAPSTSGLSVAYCYELSTLNNVALLLGKGVRIYLYTKCFSLCSFTGLKMFNKNQMSSLKMYAFAPVDTP